MYKPTSADVWLYVVYRCEAVLLVGNKSIRPIGFLETRQC